MKAPTIYYLNLLKGIDEGQIMELKYIIKTSTSPMIVHNAKKSLYK